MADFIDEYSCNGPGPPAASTREVVTDQGDVCMVPFAVAEYMDRLLAGLRRPDPLCEEPMAGWLTPGGELIEGAPALAAYIGALESESRSRLPDICDAA